MAGLVAGFMSFIFFAGQVSSCLSRSGLLPPILSKVILPDGFHSGFSSNPDFAYNPHFLKATCSKKFSCNFVDFSLATNEIICSCEILVFLNLNPIYDERWDIDFLPHLSSLQRHKTFETPYIAVIFTCSMGIFVGVGMFYATGLNLTTSSEVLVFVILLNSLVSYCFQCLSFIKNRRKVQVVLARKGPNIPDEEKPFLSPFGIYGAILCITFNLILGLSLLSLCFQKLTYGLALTLVIVIFASAILYYRFVLSKHEVQELPVKET